MYPEFGGGQEEALVAVLVRLVIRRALLCPLRRVTAAALAPVLPIQMVTQAAAAAARVVLALMV